MRVYLAEKPSQARDIAAVLGVVNKGNGLIEVKGGDVVTWARGHFYKLAPPEKLNPAWGGRWSWGQLPMVPDKFTLEAETSNGIKEQLRVIKGLLAKADTCVIATDAGREGELIAREILEEARYKGKVLRFWTSSLTPADIKRQLGNLMDGSKTIPLYEAAKARRNCDFVHGMSSSRASSIAANLRGTSFPAGRVQTPTLAMVVRRDEAIREFKSAVYYELEATAQTAAGAEFKMTHAPAESARITDEAEAKKLLRQAQGAAGPISVSTKLCRESPPLPFSLPLLQKVANKSLQFSPKKTLEVAQRLYEQKKVITYPRTDCQFLAESQKADVPGILVSLASLFGKSVSQVEREGAIMRPFVFNDSKLTDHHGIIPTGRNADLDPEEEKLFGLIAKRFVQMLGKDHQYNQTSVEMDANGVPFKATGRVTVDPGWTSL